MLLDTSGRPQGHAALHIYGEARAGNNFYLLLRTLEMLCDIGKPTSNIT